MTRVSIGRPLFVSVCTLLSMFVLGAPEARAGFDAEKARAQLLELAKDQRLSRLVVAPPPPANSAQAKLLEYFSANVEPVMDEIAILGRKYSAFKQLLDAGFYRNDEEKQAWKAEVDRVTARWSELSADPEWEKKQIELGRLAEGLNGSLAKWAQRQARALRFSQFPPEMGVYLKELMELDTASDLEIDALPSKDRMQELAPRGNEIFLKFHGGEISFDQAWREIEAIDQQGAATYGRDIAQKVGDKLNRMAVLRTQLAKSKGFRTWTEFQLAEHAEAHAAQLQGVKNLRVFLEDLLVKTDDIVREFRVLRGHQLGGLDPAELRPSQLGLFRQPTFLLLRDYFPKERLNEIWRQTMVESGFASEQLDRILLDSEPRPKKNSHAYMRPLRMPYLAAPRVNGESLDVEVPALGSPEWSPGLIYILQNFVDDGAGGLLTAFHEGGHGLDYLHRRADLSYPDSYGYAETASTTMERFLRDRMLLRAVAQTRDGQRIPDAVIETYLLRLAYADLSRLRGNVAAALFELELWDYDFSIGAETFVNRALELDAKWAKRESGLSVPADLEINPHYSVFVAPHFRSGSVTYYGYVFADVAAAMVGKALSDKLEYRTGRRTWFGQPALGPILVNELFQRGFAEPFPVAIERFTGRSFSAAAYAAELNHAMRGYIESLSAVAPKSESTCQQVIAPWPWPKSPEP